MADGTECPVWNPESCEGTSSCPPRCPRYVAPDGTAYTIYRLADCPVRRTDEVAAVTGLDPAVDDGLVAFRADAVDAWVERLDGATGRSSSEEGRRWEATVHVDDGASPVVGVELVRQLVAEAVDREADSLCVHAPAAVADAAVRDLDGANHATDDQRSDLTHSEGADSIVVDLDSDGARRTTRTPANRGDVRVSRDLDALFAPETVAVVGATDREGAIGRAVVENLASSFAGEVVPVSRSTQSVLGREAVKDVSEADADLAVVVLPADATVDAVRDAGQAGVDAVAVLSAGFGESDDEDGASRERALREIAAEHDLVLVGPNALGVLSTRRSMNASFGPSLPDPGGVSVLSHSGAVVTATLDWAASNDVGVRDVVSLGNGTGIDEADVLRYWGADPDTDVVFAYLEDVQDGDRFVEAAREVSRTTPVVGLKSGRSEAGASAAASHTGALVGDDAGFDAAFDAAGVVRAASQQAAYDLVGAFARQPLQRGDRVAVVTNAGGPGVLATDAVSDADLSLASLSAETRTRLAESLPDAASVTNPLDVLGDATVDRFVNALEVVLADDGVDAAIVASTPHPLVDGPELVAGIGDASRRYGKPVATCFSGGPPTAETTAALADASIVNYPDADRAANALAALATQAERRRHPRHAPQPVDADRTRVADVLDRAASEGRDTLGVNAMAVLDAYGVSTPAGELVTSPADAARFATAADGPFAIKVASPDLVHKSDVGGVRVGVPASDVEDAVAEVLETVHEHAPTADVTGVLVQELAPDGVECVAGVTRHARFGPMVTFGLGGVLVEHLDDVVHGLAPLSQDDARQLVESVDAAEILDGARGSDPVDLDALAAALVRLSWLAVDHPELVELEVNPFVATPDGAVAVDFHAELQNDK
ncbi:CoA-binding protein [Halorubellus sp. JP-L1]|uniref:acetate--CoA ligase family protein n=1 Tax=Halorubellus sp. JP-L1 TaxID=2715753 RepID=UPI001408F3C3|nr:acetate--CoA ligase family protein [Halorubellus sp. JP-L1]NHN42853.1 CoA-binding protein [Halorubellus sp. JP-L1]